MREVRGNYQGKGKKICIVVSRFNEFVSDKLLEGCIDELKKQGVASADITVFWVPGSFEIPQLLAKLCATKKYNAFIALGVLVRGDTPHFDYLAGETTKGIAKLASESKIPIIFGILTCDTLEQAIERAGTKQGNKGREAARSAIEMANLYQEIS
ncbi:MAG: 6,7-dimethyl-8-ribityllumazine synthase [Candidatus Omnitrophota bacterium]|nr:MAG: 6,7-dimethyl-8-ribityllumazine synthase [Candidatus Omnitrophota bacterium]